MGIANATSVLCRPPIGGILAPHPAGSIRGIPENFSQEFLMLLKLIDGPA